MLRFQKDDQTKRNFIQLNVLTFALKNVSIDCKAESVNLTKITDLLFLFSVDNEY